MTETHDIPQEPDAEPELFIAFANTLERTDGTPEDHVGDPKAMRDWLIGRSLATERTTAMLVERAMPAFRELRDLVREIAGRVSDGTAPTARQVGALNRVLRDGLHYHQLVVDPNGERFTVGQVGDELAQARSAIAGSLAHYLADHDRTRLRQCADEGCRWVFVDRSPAGRRRWCDMRTCGNRAKVARHRARTRLDRTVGAAAD